MTFIIVPGLWGPAYIRTDLIATVEDDSPTSCLVRLERSAKEGPIVVKGMSAAAVMELIERASRA